MTQNSNSSSKRPSTAYLNQRNEAQSATKGSGFGNSNRFGDNSEKLKYVKILPLY